MRKQWAVGDIFVIPTIDGLHVLGQVVGREPKVLNSVSIALFDARITSLDTVPDESLALDNVFSILFTSRELLDRGRWTVVGSRPVLIPENMLPHEEKRVQGFVGASVIGAGIVTEFVNAYYALVPWDDWKDPNFLEELLLSPDKKPSKLMYKATSK